MDSALTDRRSAARFDAPLLGHLRSTMRPGVVVRLSNLASGGALLHSARPLRPGARVHLQISGGIRVVRMSGVVLRCGVAALSVDGATYLGAVRFDGRHDLPWEEWRRPTAGPPPPAGPGDASRLRAGDPT